jgi:hypothetical protein
MKELDMLARWALDSYTHNRDGEDAMLAPLLCVVGGDLDALTTTGEVIIGNEDIPRLAFLIGYLGYPCDAVYLTCTWEALSVESTAAVTPDGVPTMIAGPPPLDEAPSMRTAIMCWAHAVPTRESVLLMRTRHLDDHGGAHWHDVAAQGAAELSAFAPLMDAAHAFDPYPIDSDELLDRREAQAILQEANGATHDTLFYDPGTLMRAAIAFEQKRVRGTRDDKQTGGE